MATTSSRAGKFYQAGNAAARYIPDDVKRPAPFLVARSRSAIYVRVQGLGSMHTASTLEAFAEAQVREGARQLVLDLRDCTGVDSTFMGLVLTISNQLRGNGNGNGDPAGCV